MVPESGHLDRPLAGTKWYVPEKVWLERLDQPPEEWLLRWDPLEDGQLRPVTARDGLLQAFLDLEEGPPQEVVKFAKRWGAIDFCTHHCPAGHTGPWPTYPPTGGQLACPPLGYQGGEVSYPYAPVGDWRLWAKRARASLDVAARLHAGKALRVQDGALWHEATGSWHTPTTLERGWRALGGFLSGWLKLGHVSPYLKWGKRQRPMLLGGWGVFGALALQLVLVSSRQEGLAVCCNCQRSYIPPRRPRPDQRLYCDGCRKKASQRDASRDYRERQRRRSLVPGSSKERTIPLRRGGSR